jgi:ribosome maturation factor RimP
MRSEEIQNLLAKKFQEEGFQDCFLISIEQKNKNIQIFIDADSGVNFEKCQKISRYLESVFDETAWFGADYVLEVSSPGIDRPLVFPRQFVKNKGRELKVKLQEGSEITGNIIDANEQAVTLTREEIRKEGKKKVKEIIETQLPYNTIKEAKIIIKI